MNNMGAAQKAFNRVIDNIENFNDLIDNLSLCPVFGFGASPKMRKCSKFLW
jgi:hypothetical protein